MKYRNSFCPIILTSIACMLSDAVFAASSVRVLGNGNTVVGATNESTDSGNKSSAVTTSAVSQTNRSSSLRFSPSIGTSASQSYSGLASDTDTGSNVSLSTSTSPSARLSIGKYLNLSHSNKTVASGGGSQTVPGGTVSNKDVDALRADLDKVQDQLDSLKDAKQNVIVGDGDYIDITGADNNVISINIDALKNDLQEALDTDREILTGINPDGYKVWWCYANANNTCSSEQKQVVDLGELLSKHDRDFVENNTYLKEALEGKQGLLTEADNGLIAINQEAGTIDVKFNELQSALGISDKKTSEIKFEDGKLQWRYSDDYEQDGVTEKWVTADINALIANSLDNYVQVAELDNYVKTSDVAGLQGMLVADENGYVKIEDNKIDVKFNELKDALKIPPERQVEIEITEGGILRWRYEGDQTWNTESRSINDLIDAKLVGYALSTDLNNLQGKLNVGPNGYLEINGNTIGIKVNELRTALNIPSEQRNIEMEITDAGTLRWRYLDEFEQDGETKKWTDVSVNISDLVDGKLADYVVRSELDNLQGKLTAGTNGYIQIDGNTIGIKFNELRTALNIPEGQSKIEMEITDGGTLRWRYLDEFEQDGETKKWTDVSVNISDLMDGKLADYVVRSELDNLQGKLTAGTNGYIQIDGNTIGIKFNELRTALNIPSEQRNIEMEITDGGTLRWRYLDEFEQDGETKKWTDVSVNISDLVDGKLADYVVRSELDNLQGKLTAGTNGYIQIDGNTIGIKFNELKTALNIEAGREIEMETTEGGVLRWRYVGDQTWNTASDINSLIDAKLVNYATLDNISGLQAALTVDEDDYLELDGNKIGIKFTELRNALNIPAERDIEMEITDAGVLRWRYVGSNTWNNVSENINDLIDAKLVGYATLDNISGLQAALTVDEDDYLELDGNKIGIKFTELRSALNIPAERDIEMEITDAGVLRWRYVGSNTWNNVSENINDLIDAKLVGYATLDNISGLQAALTVDEDDYLELDGNKIGIKFTELRSALNIPAERDIEMEITDAGVLRWRYVGSNTWNNVSENINDLIDAKLVGYALSSDLNNLQGKLTADANGYIQIDNNNVIGIKFNDLKNALGIPEPQSKIEMEITDAGVLRWRYLDEFEQDGTTKKWTVVSASIDSLINGKLAAYVDNTTLNETLMNYITSSGLSDTLQDYATKTYVDTGLGKKQVKLTEAQDGYISITPVNDSGATIGIKFNDLKAALNIPDAKSSEIRVNNGVLQWRYLDEFEQDGETKKWTDVYNLTSLLNGYVSESNFNSVVSRIDGDLAGKQITLTPADDGHILLNEETGVIGVNMTTLMNAIRAQFALDGDDARTSELRVNNGELQWRYVDEVDANDQAIWHTLDLSDLNLPYATETYVTNYTYSQTYIDDLAADIENNINITLQNLALPDNGPTDSGLYLLSVSGDDDQRVSTWQTVRIVDGEGVVH